LINVHSLSSTPILPTEESCVEVPQNAENRDESSRTNGPHQGAARVDLDFKTDPIRRSGSPLGYATSQFAIQFMIGRIVM
jgi:hypothetical protein